MSGSETASERERRVGWLAALLAVATAGALVLLASPVAGVAAGSPHGGPTASLSVSPTTAATGEAVTFDASGSSDSDGYIVQYEWDFDGDGTYDATTSGPTTSHSYASSGAYVPVVRVTDDSESTATATANVTITSPNAEPTASLSVSPTAVSPGDSVTFDASGSADPDGSITQYEWDLDGDGSYDRPTLGPTTSHSYASSGVYTAVVRVTDDSEGTATATANVTVESPNAEPTAALSVSPRTAATADPVTFDASGSSDSDGSVTRYEWDFDGDGAYDATTSGPTTSHSYAGSGAYSPVVRVTDDSESTATATASVTVESPNAEPTAALLVSPTAVSPGESVMFDASSSSDPDGSVTRYEWDFDGDGAYDATTSGPTTSHSYASSGAYVPVVRVTDDSESTAAATASVTVESSNAVPTAALALNATTLRVGDTVALDASGSSDADGAIVSYFWDLDGDLQVDSTTVTPTNTHTIATAGTHELRVVVTDDDGATGVASAQVTATEPAGPTAALSASTASARVEESITFDASVSSDPDGTVDQYEWDFDGDGAYDATTSGPTTSYAYDSVAVYAVTVRVTDDDDQTDTETIDVTVSDAGGPVAVLSPSAADLATPTATTVETAVSAAATATPADAVEGTDATSTAADTTDPPADPTTSADGPGFGVLAALLALTAGAFRRRGRE